MPRHRFALALSAVLLLAACSDLRGSERERETSARIAAENAVLTDSHVPQSVVFRNEVVVLRDDGPVVCGEFDGLNRQGGMAGFARFVFTGDEVTFDRGQPEFAERWRDGCAAS
jgi:hypothetical protein